jgi:hypothetical protein
LRAAFAVGHEGIPYEIFALYTSRHQAQRHADSAAYLFRVFAIPVYEDSREVPRALRPPLESRQGWRERVADEVDLTADALLAGEIDVVETGPVVTAVDREPPEPQEVRLLFTHSSAAAGYIQDSDDSNTGQRLDTMSVYGSYDDCPPQQRYDKPGPLISQLVHPRWPW